MKISLRKANAIQKSIEEKIISIDTRTTTTINEFQDENTLEKSIEDALSNYKINLERRSKLLDALSEIRQEVSNQNTLTGVSIKLNTLARINRDIAFYHPLTKLRAAPDVETLKGKQARLRSRASDEYVYNGNDSFEVSFLSQHLIDAAVNTVSALKKEKQRLQDELLELNVASSIELSEDAVNTLRYEDLI